MTQTRYHANLSTADARRLQTLAAGTIHSPSDLVAIAVRRYLTEMNKRTPVARVEVTR